MASPQLQIAIDAMKGLASKVGATVPEMRRAYEEMAAPVQPDVKCERVSANGVDAEWIVAPGAADDRAVLYLHGGGYVMGSINTHRDMIGRISRAAQARVLALNYRLAPEHPFPAAVEDASAGYRYLLDRGLKPARMAVAGDSAGGGLTLATLVAARDAGLPLPAAAICLSPWVDFEGLGESMKTRAHVDPIASAEGTRLLAQAYLAGKDLRTPLAAPLYADLIGHDISLAAVYDIAQRITAKYGADGYVLSRAVVPR